MFGSTYVCEQLFSFMKSTKTSQRTRLTDEHLSSLIKVGAAQTFQPQDKMCNKYYCKNFLDLLVWPITVVLKLFNVALGAI